MNENNPNILRWFLRKTRQLSRTWRLRRQRWAEDAHDIPGLRGSGVHVAELNALIAALDEAIKLKFRYPNLPILLFGDNKGVIQKLKSRLTREEGRPNMDLLSLVDETEILYDCAVRMFRGLGTSAEINWIPRKFNRADGCSKVGRQMQVKKTLDYAA